MISFIYGIQRKQTYKLIFNELLSHKLNYWLSEGKEEKKWVSRYKHMLNKRIQTLCDKINVVYMH